jgi:hypothetical protein
MTRWPNAVTRQRRERGIFAQSVEVKAVEKATDLGTLLGRVLTKVASERGDRGSRSRAPRARRS